MPSIVLDPSQRAVVDRVSRLRAGSILAVTGPAGSGKTTLIRALLEQIGYRLVLCSPTGKAAARIQEVTGAPAETLHRLLMQPVLVEDDDRGVYDRITPRKGKMFFRARGAQLPEGKILVVDESSMVTRAMYAELKAFAAPGVLVLVGDDNQLPPVADGGFSVFDAADDVMTLATVHRQGPGSVVLTAANALLTDYVAGGTRPLESMRDLPRVDQYDLLAAMTHGYATYGPENFAVITYKNASRDEITKAFREHCGFEKNTINKGEPLVITRNSRKHDVYNGDVCVFGGWLDNSATTRTLGNQTYTIRRATLTKLRDKKTVSAALLLTASSLSADDHKKLDKEFGVGDTVVLIAEFGYTLTAHKAQGSQWEHTIVAYDEMWSNNTEQKYRWAYTAITRASLSCTICELHRSSPLSFVRPHYSPETESLLTRLLGTKVVA